MASEPLAEVIHHAVTLAQNAIPMVAAQIGTLTADQRKMQSDFQQHLKELYHDENWRQKTENYLRECVPNNEICRQLREFANKNSNAVTQTRWIFQPMKKKFLHALLSGISDAGNQQLASYLTKTNAQLETPLQCAAKRGDLAAVFTLYAFGAPVERKALEFAVNSGYPPVFKALICFGVSPDGISIPTGSKCAEANREHQDATKAKNDPDELKPSARKRQQQLVEQSKAARESPPFSPNNSRPISSDFPRSMSTNSTTSYTSGYGTGVTNSPVTSPTPSSSGRNWWWISSTPRPSSAAMSPVPAPQQRANTNTWAPNRSSNTSSSVRGAHVLSLDGGGIRGLVTIQVLDALQKQLDALQRRLGTSADLPSKFDAFTGTSTGAILALALASGKSVDYCRRLYIRLKDDVFAGSRLYDPNVLESILKRELGERTTLGDLEKKDRRVMVTTTRADVLPVQLIKLCSWENEGTSMPWRGSVDGSVTEDGYGRPDWKLWKAARCSSAAPTYFPSVDATFVDGGLELNNPCGELLSELHELDDAGKSRRTIANGCVVSIGTGRNKPESVKLTDVLDLQTETYGWAGGVIRQVSAAFSLKGMILEQIGISDGPIVNEARGLAHAYQAPYYRLQPTLNEAVDLAETNDELVLKMLWDAQLYTMRNRALLGEIAGLLNR